MQNDCDDDGIDDGTDCDPCHCNITVCTSSTSTTTHP
jgi:hypothetical protein